MQQYATICMQPYAQPYAAICSHIQPYAAICSHMQPYAAICNHMQPYAVIMQPYATIYSHRRHLGQLWWYSGGMPEEPFGRRVAIWSPRAAWKENVLKPLCFSDESRTGDHFVCTGAHRPSRSPQPAHKSWRATGAGVVPKCSWISFPSRQNPSV